MRIERTDADIEIDRLFHFMAVAVTERSRRLWEGRWRAARAAREASRRTRRTVRRVQLRVLR